MDRRAPYVLSYFTAHSNSQPTAAAPDHADIPGPRPNLDMRGLMEGSTYAARQSSMPVSAWAKQRALPPQALSARRDCPSVCVLNDACSPSAQEHIFLKLSPIWIDGTQWHDCSGSQDSVPGIAEATGGEMIANSCCFVYWHMKRLK